MTNILLLSGLVVYGDDTASFDLPFRVLSGALLSVGDLPLWYPQAGDGFPQLSLEFTTWVANPLGTILGALSGYDFLSLGVENVIWRTVGFVGAYKFARSWDVAPVGAAAIAATYVGSGTMSRAAIAFATLIGQMFAPWVLVGGSMAIRAPTWPHVIHAGGVLGLSLGVMVWSAYPGAWVSAPVVSGPLLVALAMTHANGLRKLSAASGIALVLVLLLAGLIISETISGSMGELTPSYRTAEAWMRVGHVRAVDILGMLLVNPSYVLDGASDALQPLYAGTLPPLVLLATVGGLPKLPRGATIGLTLASALILANSQNWALWDHPLFRDLSPPSSVRDGFDAMALPAMVILPASLVCLVWPITLPFRTVDRIMLGCAGWVALIATDNPVANFLRFHVPPFNLVRHNMLYFWLVALVLATVAWRRFEEVIAWLPDGKGGLPTSRDDVPAEPSTDTPDPDYPMVRAFAVRLGHLGAGMLGVITLAGLTTRDAKGTAGHALVGVPHLVWQFAIAVMALTTIGAMTWRTTRSGPLDTGWMLKASGLGTVAIAIGAAIVASATRSRGVALAHVPLTDTAQLSIDLLHVLAILAGAIIVLRTVHDRSAARVLIASLMVLDAAVATPRFYSDSQRFSPAPLGWPLQFEASAESFFVPDRGDGSRKGDFWQPFTGSFRPPPTVNRLRQDWGDAYETWVHFPGHWSVAPGNQSVSVLREALGDTTDSATPRRPPTWGVSAANTGGRGNHVALEPPIDPRAIRHDACGGHVATDAPEGAVSAGRVIRLLATTVDVSFTADCDRLLVFTDSWAPGWSATIDGTPVPVLRVNNAIRAVMAPAGDHSLVWHYRPRFLVPLLALLALGIGTSFVLIAAPWWSRWVPLRPSSRLDRLFGFGPAGVPSPSTDHPILPGPPVAVAPTPATPGRSLPIWGITLAVTAIGIATVVSLALYDANIDGPSGPFRRFLVRSFIAGAWAWIVVAGRVGFASPVGPALLAIVLLPPLALQVARHADPITRGAPVHAIASDFRTASWHGAWEVVGRGDAPASGPEGITLRNDGATAHALTHALPQPSPTLWAWWQRPFGANVVQPSYSVTWTATIARAGPYYTVAKLGRLTIQALKTGLLITAPVPGGDVKGDFIEGASADGAPVSWQLTSSPVASTLSLDSRQVWSGGPVGTATSVVLGDASPDTEHRGALTIASASVTLRQGIGSR
ncbi:MAG: hypothetical protein KGR25_04675 [Chloroflexi bacterium]|nr:hypothetical protein [Chloroflexota bacterium]